MIIVRSPLRVTLGGGGTDLSSYYENYGGFVISAAINKYVYVTLTRPFEEGIFLKYSKLEAVKSVSEVSHPIIRESLSLLNLSTPQLEITTLADIPSGTGLGSSGSFTVGLLKALYVHRRQHLAPEQLAELACHIEIDKLGEPIGKQDQYAAAFGGLTCFEFEKDGRVNIKPLRVSVETLHSLEDNLMLFFTGFSRSAGTILMDQKVKSEKKEDEMLQGLHYTKALGYKSRDALESGDIYSFGLLMDEHWQHKRRRSAGMTNSSIDQWYDTAKSNGAIGGKLVGAGGGGFLMFLADDRDKLRKAMIGVGLEEVRFTFDFDGVKTLVA